MVDIPEKWFDKDTSYSLQATGAKPVWAPCWRASPFGICGLNTPPGTRPRHRICVACLGAVATTPNTWSRPIGSTVPLSWCPPSLTTPTRHIQSEPPSLSFTNLSRLFQWSYTPSPSQNCKANVPSTWDSGQTAKQLLQLQIDNEMQLLMISAPKKQRTHRFMSSKCGHTARRQQFDQQTETFLLLPDLKAPAAQISC